MRKTSVLLAIVLPSGCVSTNAVRLANAGTYPEVEPEQVQVFLTEADVKVEYEKIALINASGESNFTNEEGMIKAMQKKAGKLGANAIILGEIKDASAGAKVAAAVLGTGTQRKGQVVAIRLKDTQKQ
jgi:hypothetical protein